MCLSAIETWLVLLVVTVAHLVAKILRAKDAHVMFLLVPWQALQLHCTDVDLRAELVAPAVDRGRPMHVRGTQCGFKISRLSHRYQIQKTDSV